MRLVARQTFEHVKDSPEATEAVIGRKTLEDAQQGVHGFRRPVASRCGIHRLAKPIQFVLLLNAPNSVEGGNDVFDFLHS